MYISVGIFMCTSISQRCTLYYFPKYLLSSDCRILSIYLGMHDCCYCCVYNLIKNGY